MDAQVFIGDITNEEIDILRQDMQHRNDYLSVIGLYQQQQIDMLSTGTKQQLFNTKNCLALAGSYLSQTTISPQTYDSVVQTQQTQLQNYMSLELEVDNLILIIQNSAEYFTNTVTTFVRVSEYMSNMLIFVERITLYPIIPKNFLLKWTLMLRWLPHSIFHL